jgi:hypothetical protein
VTTHSPELLQSTNNQGMLNPECSIQESEIGAAAWAKRKSPHQ